MTPAPSPVLCCHVSAVGLFNCRESATRAGAVPALSLELRRASSRGNSRDYVLREKNVLILSLSPSCTLLAKLSFHNHKSWPSVQCRKTSVALSCILVVKFPSLHFVFHALPNLGLTSSPKHQRGSDFQWLRMRANMELCSMLWDSLDGGEFGGGWKHVYV